MRRIGLCILVAGALVACSDGQTMSPTTSVAPTTVEPSTSTSTSTTEAGNVRSELPLQPFAADSIWNRRIPGDATYVDISDVTADPEKVIDSVGLDLVTLCSTDASAPLVNVERGSGWKPEQRAVSTGEVLYQRHLAPDACTDLTFNPISNGLFVLFDPETGTADLGIGGYREPGGPLLNSAGDGHEAHGLNVFDGDGLIGYGRASLLPALGGLLRAGELDNGIFHALAVNMPTGMLSKEQHFVWPARAADGTADITYQGDNPALAMGTLLAIPADIDLDSLTWQTPQGRRLAEAAQRYGWYVVDVLLAPHHVQLGMDVAAARSDLGFEIDPATGRQSVDTTKVDPDGLNADVALIASLLHAVPQTAP